MIKNFVLALGLSLSALASPTIAQTQMENGVWVDGFRWSSGGTGTITIVYQLVNQGGKIAICGSYYMTGPLNTKQRSRQAIAAYRIRTGNTILTRNANFMKSVRTEEDLGREYDCMTTYADWFDGANNNVDAEVTRF